MTPKVYKAGEVCELVQLQPYVLRSWEKEFPGIGIQKSPESPRLYRQSDLEHVQRIKHLVFNEGLTVSGARRRLEESAPATTKATAAEAAEVLHAMGADARSRLRRVRDGLRAIQSLLASDAEAGSNGASGGTGSRSVKRLGPAPKAKAAASRASVKRGPAKREARRPSSAKKKRAHR